MSSSLRAGNTTADASQSALGTGDNDDTRGEGIGLSQGPKDASVEDGIAGPGRRSSDDSRATSGTHSIALQSSGSCTQEELSHSSQSTSTSSALVRTESSFTTVSSSFNNPQARPSQENVHTKLPQMGYLANRWNLSTAKSRGSDLEARFGTTGRSAGDVVTSFPLKRQSSSTVRMSRTADGNATVTAGTGLTPSPPKVRPERGRFSLDKPRPQLSRHSSEIGGTPRALAASPYDAEFRRSSAGRSRDSRVWEFWCDADARNALAEKADKEQSGSAADAIGLMRSNSKNALKLNSNKRNAPLLRQTSAKRFKSDTVAPKKPQLKRALTSSGRLQGTSSAHDPKPAAAQTSKKNPPEPTEQYELAQTDSDKENWEPGTGVRSAQREPAETRPNAQARHVLRENDHVMSQSNSLGALMARDRRQGRNRNSVSKQTAIAKGFDPEADKEIAHFMGGSSTESVHTSVSGEEELNCVEGLLSLKQGEWAGK